jgi:hypothetical protein
MDDLVDLVSGDDEVCGAGVARDLGCFGEE